MVATSESPTDTDGADTPTDDDTEGSVPSWLFSHTSTGGSLSERSDGKWDLTLTGVDPSAIAFTDRPDRKSAVVPLDRFVAAWPQMFADAAPNAVLVEHSPSGETDSLVVVVTDPVLEGDTLRFTAEVLLDEELSDTTGALASAPHATPPATFGAVSLFIDDVSADAQMRCVDGNGNLITPPGAVTIYYRPAAAFAATCSSLGGTVTTG